MDKWLVAVAAGAGYIAQHFKKSGDQVTSGSSNHGSFNDKPESPKQPPEKNSPFRWRKSLKQDDSEVKLEGVSSAKVASARKFDAEKEKNFCNHEGSNGIVERGDCDLVVNEHSTPKSRMFFRSRKITRRVIRPLSSFHVEMKEYMPSSFASPSIRTARPFFVTDGSKVINRASGDFHFVQNGSDVMKQQSYLEDEISSLDATLLVSLGMSFGILYSFMENKRQVERLNRLLEQKDNLVQDLEEEIEMKDSLIMQELIFDDHKSHRTDGDESPHSISHEHDVKDYVISKEKHNSFSEIEAELEAEFEMLELSMTSSNLFELEPGVAQGEFRGSTTTTHSANYAVSPRELRLRLHEVLQSQLEERIRELEAHIKGHNHKSWKVFSSSNAADENHDEPVVLNLSGEALEAYNEACDEFAKFDGSDEVFCDDGTPQNGGGMGGDERDFNDDVDDELEKLLIKHIVDKARQGSPAVLNAQRALFSE